LSIARRPKGPSGVQSPGLARVSIQPNAPHENKKGTCCL
jgi:hypothetical protein